MNQSIPYSSQSTRSSKGRTTLFVVLAIETIFFGTLIASYVLLRNGQAIWQPGGSLISRLALSGVNTMVLFLSALVAHQSLRNIQENRPKAMIMSIQITLLLGLLFVIGQAAEFRHLNFSIAGPGFGGIFFALIGFHALHVLAGMVLIGLNLMRAYLGDFTQSHHSPIEIGTLFWYYVTAVWAVLFVLLFLI